MEMTSKQRMLTAYMCKQPDRVPVSPGISNMIPCRLTGRPFWDVYYYNKIPLHTAYLDAVKYFGFDGWGITELNNYKSDERVFSKKELQKTDENIIVENTCKTPEGTLSEVIVYRKYDTPVVSKKYIEILERDLPSFKYFYPDPETVDVKPLLDNMEEMVDYGVMGLGVSIPGLHSMIEYREGGLEALTYDYYDNPELIEEWRKIWHEHTIKLVNKVIKHKPDYIMIGASGLLTLQTPDMFRKLSLPTIREVTRICRENGIPSHLHACGKSRMLVETFVNETDLNSICPLEEPLMGDVDLKEVKNKFGKKLCLKGNIHTTKVMLMGSAKDVEEAAKKCIDDAAEGGGYILATGDQCGRDTPYENLFKLAEVAKTYGKY